MRINEVPVVKLVLSPEWLLAEWVSQPGRPVCERGRNGGGVNIDRVIGGSKPKDIIVVVVSIGKRMVACSGRFKELDRIRSTHREVNHVAAAVVYGNQVGSVSSNKRLRRDCPSGSSSEQRNVVTFPVARGRVDRAVEQGIAIGEAIAKLQVVPPLMTTLAATPLTSKITLVAALPVLSTAGPQARGGSSHNQVIDG